MKSLSLFLSFLPLTFKFLLAVCRDVEQIFVKIEVHRFRFYMAFAADEDIADGIFDIIAQGIMKIYSYSSKRSDTTSYYIPKILDRGTPAVSYAIEISSKQSEAPRRALLIFSYLLYIFLCQFP